MTNQDSFGPKNPNKTRPPPQKKTKLSQAIE